MPSEKKHPFVLDMSTSVVAYGKIEIAKRKGKNIPEGWVVDEKGNPQTVPPLITDSPEEKDRYDLAKKRREERLKDRELQATLW